MIVDRETLDGAHKRLSGHDIMFEETAKRLEDVNENLEDTTEKLEEVNSWIDSKDRSLQKIKNWLIGAIVFYVIQSIGLFTFLQKIILK